MTSAVHSRQARKTRASLLEAFGELVLERRYPDIRIADIIRRADVGRSTFYEHFRNKDDLLRESLSGVFNVVAEAVEDGCDLNRLVFILEHFRQNSRRARALVNGPSAPQVVAVLATLLEARLAAHCGKANRDLALPLELSAALLAEAQVGLLRAWLNRGTACPSATVAAALHQCSTALARALSRA